MTRRKVAKSKLSKGETVTIYRDAISKQHIEGEFVLFGLSRIVQYKNYQVEEWTGQFYGDNTPVTRFIHIDI